MILPETAESKGIDLVFREIEKSRKPASEVRAQDLLLRSVMLFRAMETCLMELRRRGYSVTYEQPRVEYKKST